MNLMNPHDYEDLVADIILQLAKAESPGGGKVRILRDQVLRGRSGQDHQIDILVDEERLGVRYFSLIECKFWNRPIGVDAVIVLASRIEDLGAHKGILVTTVGYQRGAYTLAETKGIALVLCRRPKDFLVELRCFLPSDASSDMSSVIRNLYEEKYSHYLQGGERDNEIEYTAFPLLLDST